MLHLTCCSFGCQGSLLTYVELAVNQHSQISFFKAALPICRMWNLPSFNFMALIVQFSMASIFFWNTSHPSRESQLEVSFISKIANDRFSSYIQVIDESLSRTGLRFELWEAPPMTGCQPNTAPITTKLWALPSRQFFIQHSINLFIS